MHAHDPCHPFCHGPSRPAHTGQGLDQRAQNPSVQDAVWLFVTVGHFEMGSAAVWTDLVVLDTEPVVEVDGFRHGSNLPRRPGAFRLGGEPTPADGRP